MPAAGTGGLESRHDRPRSSVAVLEGQIRVVPRYTRYPTTLRSELASHATSITRWPPSTELKPPMAPAGAAGAPPHSPHGSKGGVPPPPPGSPAPGAFSSY